MSNITKNTLFTGDNLYILNGMNSRSVDLIYLDPPFNSKRTYSAPIGSKAAGASFKDMWTWKDVDEAYLERIVNDYPYLVQFIQSVEVLHSRPMMAYITYMTQRVLELHRVLKPTGSLYLHCDATASHYLKVVLDRVFGRDNYRNEIVWKRMKGAKGSQHAPKSWGRSSDAILYYAAGGAAQVRPYRALSNEEIAAKFNKQDEKGRRYFDDSAHIFRAPGQGVRLNLCFEWRGFTSPHRSGWRLSKARLEEEYQKGNIVITEDGKLERRKYLDDYRGMPMDNVWIDIPPAGGDEYTGYPTQKPLALLKRIIEASSRPGDVVLDPFCGCATTCVAAQHLQRQWIGIDIEEQAAQLVVERLSDDAGLFSDFVHRTDLPRRTDVKIESAASREVKARLFKAQKGLCGGCRTQFQIQHLEVDHIVPKSKGGGDYCENYQLLCGHCNRTKGDRPMEYLHDKIAKRDEHLRRRITFGGVAE